MRGILGGSLRPKSGLGRSSVGESMSSVEERREEETGRKSNCADTIGDDEHGSNGWREIGLGHYPA